MGSDPKYVKYTFDWKFRLADYDRIGKGLSRPRQYFVTSFKNVSFRWYAIMYAAQEAPKVEFYICYDDGPLDKIGGVEYTVGVVKSDQSLVGIRTAAIHEYHRSGLGWGRRGFEYKDMAAVGRQYGLKETDQLTYQITIQIPSENFFYCISSPPPAPCSPWAMNLFNTITINDEGNLWPPDTKVAGRDGVVFNCHKGIVVVQSKALKTIFQYPPTQDEESGEAAAEDQQSVSNPKKRKASAMDDDNSTAIERAGSVYKFPNLSAASLKSVLQYLYTGNVTTCALTVTELIEIGDAGEQYDLKPLKEFCAAELWEHVEEPAYAFEIARFADLHDDLKYLKHRALDVIAENYDRLGVKPNELVKRFGGTRGEELRDEFMEYTVRRLRPIINE